MPAGEALDDDYVISLLTKDAEANKKRYISHGLGSLLSRKPNPNAPKPNTRFLKNVIRDVDSHNAALKAKEEEESKARLRELRKDGGGRKRGREEGEEDDTTKRRRTTEKEGRWAKALGGLGERSARQDDRRRRRGHDDGPRGLDSHDERHSSHSRIPKDRKEGITRHDRSSDSKRSRRDEQRESRPRHRRRKTTSSTSSSRTESHSPHKHQRKGTHDTRTHHDEYESDPLDDIIGPRPPPKSLPRGRGAHKDASAMDARFDPNYNPKADVDVPVDEGERDDWDMALEAMRDRMKWRSKGGDRLRAAGFSEDEVRKWEGENGLLGRESASGEKDVDDVRWRKKGEGREWDHGKVVDEDGDVGLKATWARSKGSPL